MVDQDTEKYQYPLHYPGPYPPPGVPYKSKIIKRMSEMPLVLIFLICITVYWLPQFISGLIGVPFYFMGLKIAELASGISLCVVTILIMFFLRRNLDKPTLKDYGLSTQNLGSNLVLAVKLIFIIFAVDYLVILIFQGLGVSFEGGPENIDIFFIISAVIVSPIVEEVVYRMNASTLLARRLPIIWVAGITSFWFIVKHVPAWHVDDNVGLPAIAVIIPMSTIIWIVVTYYFLTRNCIWIPFLVHLFNNASIVLFRSIPEQAGYYLELIMMGVGVVLLIVYGLPKIYRILNTQIKLKRLKITKRTYSNLTIALVLSVSFLLTSEALFGVRYFNDWLCIPIGMILVALSIFTIFYLIANKDISYTK